MKFPIALCATLSVLAAPAFAHVTANPNEGMAGAYFQTSFRISHGCEGSDTTKITIQVPPGFVTMRPQEKPGWTVEVKKRKLEKPVPAGHGKMADEEIAEISWSGNKLPDAQYDDFGILTKLPQTAGRTIYFPIIQTCVKGENKWIDIPASDQKWHDVKSPAPFIRIKSDKAAPSHAH